MGQRGTKFGTNKMTIHDYFEMLQPLGRENSKSDFIREVFSNFIRTPYRNEDFDDDFNPINRYYENDDTLRKTFTDKKRCISSQCASELIGLYDPDRFTGFIINRKDDLTQFRDYIVNAGFEMLWDSDEEDISTTMSELLYKILEDIANGKKETVPPLKKLSIKECGEDSFKKAYIKDGFLYLDNKKTVKLPYTYDSIKRNNVELLPYIVKLLEIYSEREQISITTLEQLKEFPIWQKHLARQRKSYYSAEAMRRSVRDLFTDGEYNLELLENEIYDSIIETYYNIDIKDGYQRLFDVLTRVQEAQLNSTVLLNIKGLITIEERKGICHILINNGKIKSWVNVEYEDAL